MRTSALPSGSNWKRAGFFEVGVTYKARRDYSMWLAVGPTTVIQVLPDGIHETHAQKAEAYEVIRCVSVASLCGRWGVTHEALDLALAKYFAPGPTNLSVKPSRGWTQRQRKSASSEDEAWKDVRTHRLSHTRRAI